MKQEISMKEARKAMFKLGCAGAMQQILNREFDHERPEEEKATGPLCGGMMQSGLQCGMLWGASMALGSEAYRQHSNSAEALCQTVAGTQELMNSFEARAGSIHCSEFTGCDQSRPAGIARYVLSRGPRKCIKLMHDWAPEAILAADKGLKLELHAGPQPMSCASLCLKKRGASEEEQIMVAGFAGGLGLSGQACGALAAVAWFATLPRTREGNSTFFTPESKSILKAFKKECGGELLCQKVTARRFNSLDDHSAFLEEGGCHKVIDFLASA